MSFTIAYDIKAIDKFTDVAEKVQASMEGLNRTMRRVIGKNNQSTESFKKMARGAQSSSRKINDALKKTQQEAEKSKKKFEGLANVTGKMGSGLKNIGSQMTRYVTVPTAAAGVASLKMAMDFNKGMANVGTLIPGQRKRLQGFKTEVLDMSTKMGISGKDLQDGLYQTLSAFGTLDDPMKKLEIAATMGKAGMATTMESLNLLSAVTKGYGDTSDEASQKVADMSFQAVKDGQTTFPELAASIGRVVPIASAMGVKQEELFTGFATLTGVTGRASEVSTQLASVLTAMSKPSEQLRTVVKKLGFESASWMVKNLGLHRTMNLVAGAVGHNSDKMAEMLGRKEALVGMLALTGAQSEVFSKKMKSMGDVVGATSAAYNEQVNGINKTGVSWERTKQKLARFMVLLGDRLLPILETFMTKYLDPLISKLESLSDEQLMSGMKFAGIAAAIGPVIGIIGSLISAISGVSSAIAGAGGLSAVLAVVTGPVGLVIAAIVALIAIIASFWDELEPIREVIQSALIDAWSSVEPVISVVIAIFKDLWEILGTLISVVASIAAPFLKLGLIMPIMQFKFFMGAVEIVVGIVRVLVNVVKFLVTGIKFLVMWMANLVAEFLTTTETGKVLMGAFQKIGEVVSWLFGLISELWGSVTGFFAEVSDWLGSVSDEMNAAADRQGSLASAKIRSSMEVSGEALATTNQNVNMTMEINAPAGVVGDVKQKTNGGYANLKVGKNERN